MANRLDPEEQNFHDRVVSDIMHEDEFYPSGCIVTVNPSSQKNRDVDGQYPDIVCFDPRTDMNLMIGEVETESSINDYEAGSQWRDYAQLHIPFHLFVPDTHLTETRELLNKYNIQASIHIYHYRHGVIVVV